MSLSRLYLRSSPRKRGPRGQVFSRFKAWVPASAGTNGDWFNGGARKYRSPEGAEDFDQFIHMTTHAE